MKNNGHFSFFFLIGQSDFHKYRQFTKTKQALIIWKKCNKIKEDA